MASKEMGRYTCCQCGRTYPQTEFNKACSSLYKGIGHLPICKQCITELYETYYEKYKDKKKAIQRICMAFDLYYDDSVFKSCSYNDTTTIIGTYIKCLNMYQYKGKTFEDTMERDSYDRYKLKKQQKLNRAEKLAAEKQEAEKQAAEIPTEDIEKWGTGFGKVDYDILNSHYKLLKESNPNCDTNQEIFINDLCYIKMQQMKAAREGNVDDFNKLTDSYRKSFKEAGLKTTQEVNMGSEDCWGNWTSLIEGYTPAEYYKNKELFKDHDGIGDYFKRLVLRPLRNLKYGTTDRDYEYCIGDDEDVE